MSILIKAIDYASSWGVSRKISVTLFPVVVLFPLGVLLLAHSGKPEAVTNFIVIYLVCSVILFVPFSRMLSHVLAVRNIRELNDQCQRLKEGDYEIENLPPERGEEHDFMRLKRNLHWMGYAIAARERKLSGALNDLAEAQGQIVESIDYASLIQTSFLPDPSEFETMFSDHFLLWDQRDKVGGDAYWFRFSGNGYFVAVIDCTGHGVPGAFMTLIVHSLFETAVSQSPTNSPAEILGRMNRLIKDSLGQNGKGTMSDDGMDCSLCYVDISENKVVFAGANNGLFVVEHGSVEEVKGDRCGVGYVRSPRDFQFTDHEVSIRSGMRFYMTTDGIIDQVGGGRQFPFGKRRFRNFLSDHTAMPLAGQDRVLRDTVEAYRGKEPRRDDITVLGFEL